MVVTYIRLPVLIRDSLPPLPGPALGEQLDAAPSIRVQENSSMIRTPGPFEPCAPMMEPMGPGIQRVLFSAPPGSTLVCVWFHSGVGACYKVQCLDTATGQLSPVSACTNESCPASAGSCVVQGLDNERTYTVTLTAWYNSIRWSAHSPASAPIYTKSDASSSIWLVQEAELRKRAMDVEQDSSTASGLSQLPKRNKRE